MLSNNNIETKEKVIETILNDLISDSEPFQKEDHEDILANIDKIRDELTSGRCDSFIEKYLNGEITMHMLENCVFYNVVIEILRDYWSRILE